jgi:hypothetical protein
MTCVDFFQHGCNPLSEFGCIRIRHYKLLTPGHDEMATGHIAFDICDYTRCLDGIQNYYSCSQQLELEKQSDGLEA